VADNVLAGGRVATGEAEAMAAFNDKLRADSRIETLMLPLRDGVTIARKL
jgi:caffeoyl-CoA O-methyltransferase